MKFLVLGMFLLLGNSVFARSIVTTDKNVHKTAALLCQKMDKGLSPCEIDKKFVDQLRTLEQRQSEAKKSLGRHLQVVSGYSNAVKAQSQKSCRSVARSFQSCLDFLKNASVSPVPAAIGTASEEEPSTGQ
ncbi:MAG: hypothetical protein V4736_16495 [Bdellovibrionota bacterium]